MVKRGGWEEGERVRMWGGAVCVKARKNDYREGGGGGGYGLPERDGVDTV